MKTTDHSDIREIKILKNDKYITIKVDWNKMPCKNCEWRYSMHCPHFDWCKKSNICTY